MRVLVVEDEKKLAGFIRRALKEDGYAVDLCHDGDDAFGQVRQADYDAIVLDLQLPGRSGMSVLEDLRERKKETPVLILTARDSVKDRVLGLDSGADDYLTKPFALAELRARVRVLLRRDEGRGTTRLAFAGVEIDLATRKVLCQSREIEMTPKEFSVLEYFLRNPGQVLTRTAIAEHVWDYHFDWNSNVVDVFVNAVRRKVEETGAPRLIHTIRTVGYVLKETK